MAITDNDIRRIITDPNGTETLVTSASSLAQELKKIGLTTAQIRALFGEIRQIEAEWGTRRADAIRRLILLKPKMAYRARKERGQAVRMLVDVLDKALDLVTKAEATKQDEYFRHFVEFFEAILAYHKAYGGS